MPVVAVDPFKDQLAGGGTPAMDWPLEEILTVTASDTDELVNVARAILLPAAGTLRITTNKGTVQNFVSGELAAGVWHPMRIRKLHATGSAAATYKVGY
jgi:hypothetical protein